MQHVRYNVMTQRHNKVFYSKQKSTTGDDCTVINIHIFEIAGGGRNVPVIVKKKTRMIAFKQRHSFGH